MNKRDQEILDNLRKFKVLDRDQIIALHFNDQKQPVVTCNRIMNRLVSRGQVSVNRAVRPYDYFSTENPIRHDSNKLSHFKNVANFVIEMSKVGKLTHYEVEPKLGQKGTVEPDVYMVWNNAPFFVEVQRTVYSKKFMNHKMDRYKEYYNSNDWKIRGKYFPYIWIVSDHVYDLDATPLRLIQTKSVDEFLNTVVKKKGDQ